MRRHTARIPLATALAATAALAAHAAPAAAADSDAISHQVMQSPQEVREFWTEERMRAAQPAPAPAPSAGLSPRAQASSASPGSSGRPTVIPPSGGAATYDFEPGAETEFPQRVHGKVFFTPVGEGLAMCSGTLVASRLENVVFTAAHCVAQAGSYVTNLIFVPAYRDGEAPFGTFPATGMIVDDHWMLAESLSFDAAIVQLGLPLESQLGARGVAFNKAPKSTYRIYGYPAKPAPYDGERLIGCDSSFYALSYTGYPFSVVAAPCNMMQGSSGGGWVIPSGHVTSVVSHGSCDFDPSSCGQISGPYFGEAVKDIYNDAGGSAQCPPARQRMKIAKRKLKRAKTASRRAHTRRAERRGERRLRKSRRSFGKAKARLDRFC